MSAVQQVDLLTLPPVAGLPTRDALAAWLELEAALISATQPGTEERRGLRLVMIASRPNDNEHVASTRRIARLLRDPEVLLVDVLVRVKGARHFRAVVRHTIERFLGPIAQDGASLREAYLAAQGATPEHGEPDFEVERATDETGPVSCKGSGTLGPEAESMIDIADPHWMIPGANEPCIEVRTDEGLFEVPVSSLRVQAPEVATT